jgi:hypothetical protein
MPVYGRGGKKVGRPLLRAFAALELNPFPVIEVRSFP